MSIGMTPLTPLHRVLADPEARFQRFGSNDSQLFGKALVNLAQTVSTDVKSTGVLSNKGRFAAGQVRTEAATAPEPTPVFLNAVENQTAAASVSKPGTYLDLKA